MKTLDEIKKEVAKERGYNSFRNMHPNMVLFEELSDVIAERYAHQRVNEVLDKAVDQIKKGIIVNEKFPSHPEMFNDGIKEALRRILKLKK